MAGELQWVQYRTHQGVEVAEDNSLHGLYELGGDRWQVCSGSGHWQNNALKDQEPFKTLNPLLFPIGLAAPCMTADTH